MTYLFRRLVSYSVKTWPRFCHFFLLCLVPLLWAVPAHAQVVLSVSGFDQQVQPPSASVNLVATLTQPTPNGAWFIQSGTITIDGTAYPAQVYNNTASGSTLSYTWDSSQATNPSEHTISASAQVQFEYEGPPSGTVYTISSTAATAPAQGPYPPNTFYGDGRAADFIIAQLIPQSLAFQDSLPLNQTPVLG